MTFDGLLRTLESSDRKFVAYADDLVVLVERNSSRKIDIEGQRVIDSVVEWCRSAKLEISEEKTEAIFVRYNAIERSPIARRGGDRPDHARKNRPKTKLIRYPTSKIGRKTTSFKEIVRYLEVHFNRCLSVSSHCRYLRDKVFQLFCSLRKVTGVSWRFNFSTLRTIYRGVFVPSVAYAAAAWADLCRENDRRSFGACRGTC